jgi:hypothetical protein
MRACATPFASRMATAQPPATATRPSGSTARNAGGSTGTRQEPVSRWEIFAAGTSRTPPSRYGKTSLSRRGARPGNRARAARAAASRSAGRT